MFMMHELGHALGLPHMKGEYSEIMTSHGFGGKCKDQEDERRCDFTDYDFERFLWPYKPQDAYVRRYTGGGGGGGGGGWGFGSLQLM